MPEETADPAGPAFALEYVTSALSVWTGDGIGISVVNDSSVAESTRVVIYKNTGAGAVTVLDTGRVAVGPTWTWITSLPAKDSGDYWLRIQATSESLIPRALLERFEGAISKRVENYLPGDFAVFSLTRKRLW